MAEVTLRPMTGDDADVTRVVALMQASERSDRTDEHYDADDVREDLADPLIDPSRDWVLAEDGGDLVGYAALGPRAADAGEQRIHLGGTVHPQHRRRGIGSRLVGWAAGRAREHAAERGTRPVLSGTAPDDLAGVTELMTAHGLLAHRWTFVMEADLTGELTPAAPVPDGWTLTTWEGVDAEELRAAHNAAFPGHPGFAPWSAEMWRQRVTTSRNDRPAMSLLLRAPDGAIASYVHSQEFDADTAATGRRESFVAKVGTLPGHRKQGLAGLLLAHTMRLHQQEGYLGSSLDVDSENPSGANAVYTWAGFVVTRRWINYEGS